MAIERARARVVPKPWGVADLRPWSRVAPGSGVLVGEIWYERPGEAVPESSLLLKLLFTNQPLSIQVHPDDAYAHSMGLPRGKTEAWYIVDAAPGAKVALGLQQRLAPGQLRAAVDDGSIVDLVAWQTVSPEDAVFVPAGTIHAIGAGLVIAEIQQRSDATFRLFDFDRKREIHVESAIAVADNGPVDVRSARSQLTEARTLLVANPHFAFERIDLAPNSAWCLDADRETWLLVLGGSAHAGPLDVARGDAVFAQSDQVDIQAGPEGLTSLVAYTGAGGPISHLLKRPALQRATDPKTSGDVQLPTSLTRTKMLSAYEHPGAPQ